MSLQLNGILKNADYDQWVTNDLLWGDKTKHKQVSRLARSMAKDLFTVMFFVGVTVTEPFNAAFDDMLRFLWMDAFLRSVFFKDLRKKTARNPGLSYIAAQKAAKRWERFYRRYAAENKDFQGQDPIIPLEKPKKVSLLKRFWEWLKSMFINSSQLNTGLENETTQKDSWGSQCLNCRDIPQSLAINPEQMDLDVASVLGDVMDAEQLAESLGHRRTRWQENPCYMVELMERQRSLREFAEQIGRMVTLANKTIRECCSTRDNEYRMTSDLSSILPSELALGVHPLGESLFMDRYNKGSLWGLVPPDEPEEQRGPMIVLIDVSESITPAKERDEKALALGLYEIAKARKQAFHAILFSGIGERMVIHFTGDSRDDDLKELLLTTYFGHGTYYAEAILQALEIFESNISMGGDMVLITDGEFKDSREFTSRIAADKQRLGFRIFGVLFSHQKQPVLEAISDNVWTIDSVERDAANLFKGVFV